MTAGSRQPIVVRADLVRFFVAFGVVPLLLARIDFADPPWSFVLTASWTPSQLLLMAVAGAVIGSFTGRLAQGLAAVALGVLVGLAVDLWWFAGQVRPYDQAFVTMLARDEWWSRMASAAIVLSALVASGFLVGAMLRRSTRDRSGGRSGPPVGSAVAAIGIAVVGCAVLSFGIAAAAASSALVVPDGAPVQTVSVRSGDIAVAPMTLRSGPTHVRCVYSPDATSAWTRLVAAPDDVDIETILPVLEDLSSCGPEAGSDSWGSVADLPAGRYMWVQVEQREVPRLISTSPIVIVGP